MRTISTHLSLSASLVASLCVACTDPGADPNELDNLEETAQASDSSTTSVTPLPSFTSTPNIQQAMALLSSPSVTAVLRTVSGFQIYRCDQGATAPEWKLRTPLAGLDLEPNVLRPSLNRARLASLVGNYHYRSDFGTLLASSQIDTLGLAVPAVNAPVWDFTFQPCDQPVHREVLAGRLLAQDTTSSTNIPMFLLEVRGRAIDPGTPSAIASATHVLRWNTRGGLAPAAATCDAASLGREVQSPYSANYYFLSTAP